MPIPPEPTPEMMAAALPTVRALMDCDTGRANSVIKAIYDLIIEVAPPLPCQALTDDQSAVLVIIDRVKTKTGKVPSHREISEEVDFSRPKVSYIVKQLAKLGYLRPARRYRRTDGQMYSKKFAYTIVIRPDPHR